MIIRPQTVKLKKLQTEQGWPGCKARHSVSGSEGAGWGHTAIKHCEDSEKLMNKNMELSKVNRKENG